MLKLQQPIWPTGKPPGSVNGRNATLAAGRAQRWEHVGGTIAVPTRCPTRAHLRGRSVRQPWLHGSCPDQPHIAQHPMNAMEEQQQEITMR